MLAEWDGPVEQRFLLIHEFVLRANASSKICAPCTGPSLAGLGVATQ